MDGIGLYDIYDIRTGHVINTYLPIIDINMDIDQYNNSPFYLPT